MDISLFFNAKLPGRDGLYCVETRQGYLSLILPMDEVNMLVRPRNATDLNGDWLSLGGIDSQINGALGLAFGELTPDHFQTLDKISQYLWEQGVDAYLPTLVTADIDKMRQSLETLSKFMNERCLDNRAYILGVHIEGSFCNSEKGGTQPTECLKPLTLESLQVLFGEYIKLIRVITLAPELDSTGEVIPWLCEHGILANLGHSLATAVQTKAAFGQGAMMVTPALNTMSSLQYGEMGLLGATILEPKISCGLIADGQHISPQIMDLLLRARRGRRGNAQHRCENVFLVSDALAQLGLADGTYPWHSHSITIEQGTARLPDGTVVGTTHPLLDGVKNLAEWGVADLGEAISMATDVPRRLMGLPGLPHRLMGLPRLQSAQPVNLLRWHWDEENKKLSWERL